MSRDNMFEDARYEDWMTEELIKELRGLQKRTPSELDFTINQKPKKRLKKVM